MKRILTFLLAMTLILSSFVFVSAEIVEEEIANTSATTSVVVYKQDFEADELPATWKSGNTAQFAVSLDTDSTGNKYLKAGGWKADNLATRGANWVKEDDGTWVKAYTVKDGVKTTTSYRLASEASR